MSAAPFSDVRRFTTIDSTNRYLADEARAGAPEGLVAVADFQTAGRGRLGRTWEAPAGASLLASVLLRPDLEPGSLHLCTAMMALAGADACEEAAGVRPDLKWPNDLLVAEHKVAGILAELVVAPGADAARAVVVGIGVNLSWAGPRGAGGTCLDAEAGRPVEREAVLECLLGALARRRPLLGRPAGRSALVDELRQRCVTLGRAVQVTLADRTVDGTAAGLDDDGLLLLQPAGGGEVLVVTAADVVHLRPGPR